MIYDPPLTVLVPLGVEARAVRGALDGARIVRCGMGLDAAAEAAARVAADGAGPVAVMGTCAALGDGLRPGDIVVASEVRGPDGDVSPCPAAGPLVAALRARGARVHHGAVASVAGIVRGEQRARLAATGAIAADMESSAVVRPLGDRPVAVLRAVVDTPAHELVDLRTPLHGLAALRALRRAAPALAEWAAAAGPRRVLLAGPRSFCAGVDRAIEVVERALEEHGAPVYVRKEIVHNAHVVADLGARGAVFVDELDEVPDGALVVFSAHGVSPAVRADAAGRGLDVVDATCPLVTKVHAEVRRFARDGYDVVLVGHDGHEEVEGTVGEAPSAVHLVEDPAGVDRLDVADPGRVAFVSQTTLAVDEVAEVVRALRRRFPDAVGPGSDDICYATQNRQDAVRAVARDADLILVVGSRNSSNSRRLVEVAEREGCEAHLVDDDTEVSPRWLAGAATVGLSAGASAPESHVRRLAAMLAAFGPVETEERTTTTETIRFTLPKELR